MQVDFVNSSTVRRKRWEKNMKPLETKQFPSEVITIDGCTVIMRYAEKPAPGVMEKVKDTLVNHNFLDKKPLCFVKMSK